MAENSAISWTDHTFNGWWGCTKVSPACTNCYAEAFAKRTGHDVWGKGKPRRLLSDKNWNEPLKWNAGYNGDLKGSVIEHEPDPSRPGVDIGRQRRLRVFCSSMADWLDDEVPIEWFGRLMLLIWQTQNLDYLLLTKRVENWLSRINELCKLWACDGSYHETPEARCYHEMLCAWRAGTPPDNVWIGTTVENQEWADRRIPHLLKIPAKVRFLSIEPMLGEINLSRYLNIEQRMEQIGGIDAPWRDLGWHSRPEPQLYERDKLHWVIVGGESGRAHKKRQLNLEWVRSIHDQCQAAGVPFFMKQDSGPRPGMRGRISDNLWKQEFPRL